MLSLCLAFVSCLCAVVLWFWLCLGRDGCLWAHLGRSGCRRSFKVQGRFGDVIMPKTNPPKQPQNTTLVRQNLGTSPSPLHHWRLETCLGADCKAQRCKTSLWGCLQIQSPSLQEAFLPGRVLSTAVFPPALRGCDASVCQLQVPTVPRYRPLPGLGSHLARLWLWRRRGTVVLLWWVVNHRIIVS